MTLTRRQVLQRLSAGAGSFAVAPLMGRLVQMARNEPPEQRRYVFVVKSSGIDREPLLPEGLAHHWEDRSCTVDVSLGDHELPYVLEPLAKHRDKLTVVQGLSGAHLKGNHTAGYGTLSGFSSERAAVAPTVDWMLGDRFSGGPYAMFGLTLTPVLLGQATRHADSYCYPNISAMGPSKGIAFQGSPDKAYRELFGAAVFADADSQRRIDTRRDLLDFLRDDARRVSRELTPDERERFEGYTTALKSLRSRDERILALGDRIADAAPDYADRFRSEVETTRLECHFDIAASALISGLTNVVTIRTDSLGVRYSGLGMPTTSVHAIGHHGEAENGWSSERARAEIRRFQMGLIGRLADVLAACPEGDGSMLDNTTIVFLSCAGGSHHGGLQDWPFVVLSGCNQGLRTRRYVQYPSYRSAGHRTVGNLHATFLHAAGIADGELPLGQLDPALADLELGGALPELVV